METIINYTKDTTEGRKAYFWIWAIINGKLFIDGAYSTQEQAYAMGYEKVKHYFEVEQLPTKDMNTATRIIKHKRLETTNSIEEAMQRAKHKL